MRAVSSARSIWSNKFSEWATTSSSRACREYGRERDILSLLFRTFRPGVRTHKGGFLGQQGVLLSLPWREEALSNQFWLFAAQGARLQPLLPTATRGVPRGAARRVISGMVQVLQSGWRWRATPPVYGPSKPRYNRFVRWARKGVWAGVFTRRAGAGGPPPALLLDATPVKASRAAAGGKGGRPSR